MDYVKSVIQEKMQVWMNIMIKYFTLPLSTASLPDAEKNWNCYAPIQDSYLPQESHIPEEISFSESFYTGTKARHHCRSVWPLNMIPCYFNQKMTVDGHVDLLQL